MAPSGSGSKKARANQRTSSDRVSQMRKEQQKKDRRRVLAIWGAAAVVIAIIAGAVTFAVIHSNANKPDLSAVKSYKYDAGAHTQEPVKYKENPPVGGEHNPVWLNCGVYDRAGAQRERRPRARARRRLDHLQAGPAPGRRRQAQGAHS